MLDPDLFDDVQGIVAERATATCPTATSLPHLLLAVPGFAG